LDSGVLSHSLAHSGSLRLPTRCPVCKGGVIERQPSATHGTFMWFHCLFCNHWWRFRIDAPCANPNVELTGQVFVVTKRGVKYKLGSVAVSAIPEDAFRKYLQNKTLQGELETRKLERDIRRLTAALPKTEAEEDRLWTILQRDETNSHNADAWSAAYSKAKSITKQIEDLQARRAHLRSGEYFFEGLPSGLSSAKTDANGKFTLSVPRQGRYGVVACASRELFKKHETYFWFVWVSPDRESAKRLTLSNHNLLGAGSPDSALR
jgi:hypothetical protein